MDLRVTGSGLDLRGCSPSWGMGTDEDKAQPWPQGFFKYKTRPGGEEEEPRQKPNCKSWSLRGGLTQLGLQERVFRVGAFEDPVSHELMVEGCGLGLGKTAGTNEQNWDPRMEVDRGDHTQDDQVWDALGILNASPPTSTFKMQCLTWTLGLPRWH